MEPDSSCPAQAGIQGDVNVIIAEPAWRRFVPLSVAAGAAWALYNAVVGAFFGAVLADSPVLAVVSSIVVAVTLGVAIDALVSSAVRRREARESDQ